ncbi:vegetative cell wall protein gp1-like [Capsicum annuum]|uniref:vegetative cell wall protein gp1-like n=1 Tax=Capsicum annuum TaxID=4072 RepID=UPI001FB1496D|nr:vegetative cell wall protein gp1-like [Capsicum annuum]
MFLTTSVASLSLSPRPGPRPSAPSPTVGADPTRPSVPGVDHRRRSNGFLSLPTLSLSRAPVSGPIAVADLRRRPDRRSPTPTPGPDRRSPTPTSVAERRFPPSPAVPPHPTPTSPSSGAGTTVQQPKLGLQPQPSLGRQQPQIHLSSEIPRQQVDAGLGCRLGLQAKSGDF